MGVVVGVVKLWMWFVVAPKIGFEKLATMCQVAVGLATSCSVVCREARPPTRSAALSVAGV